MKKIVFLSFMLTSSLMMHAGDYLTNTNQHTSFLRNISRDASIEIDAVYSNPAGLSFMSQGWHFSLNSQSAFQKRTINSSFTPFAANIDGQSKDGNKGFLGEASAPIVPSAYVVYRGEKWTFVGGFGLTGGGGKATFNDGLPSFESQVALIPMMLTASSNELGIAQMSADKYGYDTYMQGRQYVFGTTFGMAYKLSEHFSAFIGARANYVSNHYQGYLHNLSANLGNSTTMAPLSATFTNIAAQYTAAAALYAANGEDAKATSSQKLAQKANEIATLTADRDLECDQSGWGITPIIGFDYKIANFNFGIKYEFMTNLNIQNETKINTTGKTSFDDGINTPNDIPAYLSVGASYKPIDRLKISIGYHHFFDKESEMQNGREDALTRGTNEYTAGLEYQLTTHVLISGGFQRTSYGLSDDFQQDMSFYISSCSYGFGAKIDLSKRVKLNLAYFFTNYENYEKNSSNYYGSGVAGSDLYKRTNKIFGIGIDYDL